MSISDRFRRLDGWLSDDSRVIPLPSERPPFNDTLEDADEAVPFEDVTAPEATDDTRAEEPFEAPDEPLIAPPSSSSSSDTAPWRSAPAEPEAKPALEWPTIPEVETALGWAVEPEVKPEVEPEAKPTRSWADEPEAEPEAEPTRSWSVEPEVDTAANWVPAPPPSSSPDASLTGWSFGSRPELDRSESSLLDSLTAALNAPEDAVPAHTPAPLAVPEAPQPIAGVEAEAAPVALPLASPAFARSKYGAMRRDETPAPVEAPVTDTSALSPRTSVFAPAVTPADAPRPTAYGLGDKGATEGPVDPLASLKKRVEDALLRRLGTRLAEGELDEDELRVFVERELGAVLAGEQTALRQAEQDQIVSRLTDDLLGHGPMEQFLQDDSVTEVMVSGLEPMYIERSGHIVLTDVRFQSEAQLRQVIERIVGRIGRRIDESSPMVDARLPDGSRVNAIIPPLAVDGPALTIRKFSRRALTVDDLIEKGSLNQNAADMLSACVRGRLNILVSGGTGSGKTTMLNVLSSFIPTDQRIVTIEDAVELRLNQHHVIRLEARPANIEGRGEVTIRDLMRNALRMRPDRIIVGEVRSGEALDMLQAMNTGHDGSLSTLHANQPRDALARLETMVLMAGFDLPVRAIREQMASAVDMIVHISRLRDGTRRVTHIVEVEGMEGDIITLTDLFVFDYAAGIDDTGRFRGELKATGLRPKFTERLADQGIDVPLPAVGFDPNGEIAVASGFGWNR